MTIFRTLRRCLADQRGATAIEYALLGALIATAVIASVGATGQTIADLFGATNAAFVRETGRN